MKNKIGLIIVVTIMLNAWFWPKDKKEEFIDKEVTYPKEIVVNIEGEVTFPGTYIFYENITLKDVLTYAGNIFEDDLYEIDFNEVITKSKSFKITKKNNENNENNNESIKLNINKATFQDLIKIPNITEKRAANIIIYREQNGLFISVDELIKVKYIGVSVLEKISNYLTV